MTETAQTLAAAFTRAGEGEARWWFGGLAEITLTAAETGGALSVIDVTDPPGAPAPLHVHHREDETFYILEGHATFEVGGEVVQAGPGDTVFGPRGVPHRYTVGDSGCRMLFIMTPGGFEDLVRETSVPAGSRTLPPPMEEEPDWERVDAIARAHGCEVLA